MRGPAGATHPIRMIYSDPGCTDFADTPLLAATPYFRAVLAGFACPLQAVGLMRLASGSLIKEHTDLALAFEPGTVRIHIPVTTNAEVDFRLNGVRCTMPAGSSWYLRLSDPHSVANRGMSERVHMVIDAVVNDWVAALSNGRCRLCPPERRIAACGLRLSPHGGRSMDSEPFSARAAQLKTGSLGPFWPRFPRPAPHIQTATPTKELACRYSFVTTMSTRPSRR